MSESRKGAFFLISELSKGVYLQWERRIKVSSRGEERGVVGHEPTRPYNIITAFSIVFSRKGTTFMI